MAVRTRVWGRPRADVLRLTRISGATHIIETLCHLPSSTPDAERGTHQRGARDLARPASPTNSARSPNAAAYNVTKGFPGARHCNRCRPLR